MNVRRRPPWVVALVCLLAVMVVGAGVWVWHRSDDASLNVETTTTTRPPSTSPTSSKPLSAPIASAAEDGQFLAEVTEADPSLTAYEKKAGNVALRSLLTDGSAFCAFLQRDRDLDDAMVSLAVGARQVESQTHLPLSVTTFNAIDAVALLTLCPSLQKLLPPSDVAKIRQLGASLAGRSG